MLHLIFALGAEVNHVFISSGENVHIYCNHADHSDRLSDSFWFSEAVHEKKN